MKILFRVDSGAAIGSGHLMRCLALADRLHEAGAQCHFACRPLAGDTAAIVTERGHVLHRVDDAGVASLGRFDRLVIDHYAIDARLERTWRANADRLLVIDDLADRPHDCDLLLDQNLSVAEHRYAALVPPGCRQLLGPRYALLRPDFAAARAALRDRDGAIRSVIVSFGGVDATNQTAVALDALARLERPDLAIEVVLGATSPHRDAIARRCAAIVGARLHVQPPQLANMLAQADLAIGAGGVSSWERCSVGLPAIAWPIADNQQPVIEALAAAGALITPRAPDAEVVARQLAALLDNPVWVRVMGDRARALCDGRGAARVAALLMPPVVELRPATAGDCADVLEWRNHPDVRRVSIDPRPIDASTHRAWFERTLASDANALLIAEARGAPVGVLRLDFAGTSAEVSIYLVPGHEGRGYGTAILGAGERWLAAHAPAIRELAARVVEGNDASAALFSAAGFRPEPQVFRKRLETA